MTNKQDNMRYLNRSYSRMRTTEATMAVESPLQATWEERNVSLLPHGLGTRLHWQLRVPYNTWRLMKFSVSRSAIVIRASIHWGFTCNNIHNGAYTSDVDQFSILAKPGIKLCWKSD